MSENRKRRLKTIDKSELAEDSPTARLQTARLELAKECLHKALAADDIQRLLEELVPVFDLKADLSWTALSSPIRDPVSGLGLPIPSPQVAFADRHKRYGLTTDDLRAHIDLNYADYRLAGILMLEELHRVDRRLYSAIHYKAKTKNMAVQDYVMNNFQILSHKIMSSDSKRFKRQLALFKALGLYNEAVTRLDNARRTMAALCDSVQRRNIRKDSI